jgi:putative toxin-antitoxin system antitoxin component (TIGR02293 family)
MAQVVEVLEQLLSDNTIDTTDVARVLGTTSRSVARWQTDEVSPRRESEERLLELKAVVDLARRFLRPEPARLWLRSPNPELSYEKPLDLITRGEYRRVIGALLAMAEGVTA